MFNNQTEDDIEMDEQLTVQKFTNLHKYYIMIIDPIGILGNIISLIILIRIYFKRKSNICILYTIICGLNIINSFYKNMGLMKIKLDLSILEKQFIQHNVVVLLAWMQALISFLRFIYVVFQSRAKILTKKIVIFLVIFFTFTMSFVINSTILMGQTSLNKTNNTNTSFIHDNKELLINTKILVPFFSIIISYFLVLGLNIIIILRLRRSVRRRFTSEQDENIMNEFVVSTISIDLIYLIFKAPKMLIKFFDFCFSLDSSYFLLIEEIFNEWSHSFSDLLVFIFYFFEASFRKEIIIILCFFRRKLFRSSFT